MIFWKHRIKRYLFIRKSKLRCTIFLHIMTHQRSELINSCSTKLKAKIAFSSNGLNFCIKGDSTSLQSPTGVGGGGGSGGGDSSHTFALPPEMKKQSENVQNLLLGRVSRTKAVAKGRKITLYVCVSYSQGKPLFYCQLHTLGRPVDICIYVC